jgi:molybdopterin/thiamine biosynthesis adenylyltransferase
MPELDTTETKVIVRDRFYQEDAPISGKGYLLGRRYDAGDVWHLVDTAEESGFRQALFEDVQIVGKYTSRDTEGSIDGKFLPTTDYLDVTIGDNEIVNVRVVQDDETIRDDISVRPVDLDRLFIRLDENNTQINELSDKKVGIVGLGSGGSLLAMYLAKSGVEDMVFIDGDRYEEHNIVRHICGINDIGRKKVTAVKEHIQDRIPEVSIETVNSQFKLRSEQDAERFERLLGDCDAIISATGRHNINFRLESFIQTLERDITVFYGGMFSDLKGGILIRVSEEKSDPTYHEIYEEESGSENPDIKTVDVEGTYQPPEEEDAHSVPGLGIDVDNLTIFMAKMVLTELLENVDHDRYELGESMYVWANREFEAPSFNEDVWYRYPPLELSIIPESNIK